MTEIKFKGREVTVRGIGMKWIPLAQVRISNGLKQFFQKFTSQFFLSTKVIKY